MLRLLLREMLTGVIHDSVDEETEKRPCSLLLQMMIRVVTALQM